MCAEPFFFQSLKLLAFGRGSIIISIRTQGADRPTGDAVTPTGTDQKAEDDTMKMDRNENTDGVGKYAVINLRKLNETCGHAGIFHRWSPEVEQALKTLEDVGALEWGRVGEQDEFFLVKLKDVFAPGALRGYAAMADGVDPEWAAEVREMLPRSGIDSPFCKRPD